MKIVAILGLLSLCVSGLASADTGRKPPNIIVVMADDHALWASGGYGNDAIHAPNMDWLAQQGVVFRNAYSPAPVCSPARASFYTGRMPSQHGVHDFLGEGEEFDASWLESETLLSERLRARGYRTGLFGKWHATTDSRIPQRGFDRWLSYDAYVEGWINQYRHSGTVYFSDDGEARQHTGVQARHLTEEAISFIDDGGDEPFFISLNFVEPHAPFEGLPERLVDRYRDTAKRIIRAGAFSNLPDRGPITRVPDDHYEQLAQYLAAVSLVDEQLGRLLDALQGRQLLDDTVLVYTSDHGLLVGQYGLYGKTNASYPSNFYEETIRIPLIIYAPDMRAMQSRDEFVDLIDLHNTVLDYAGDELPHEYGPGRSIRRLVAGARDPLWRRYRYAERGNARMVSDGHWKLVRYHQRDPDDAPLDTWYDLSHPLGEQFDSPPPRATVQASLGQALDAFFARYETPGHSGRLMWQQPPSNPRDLREREEGLD